MLQGSFEEECCRELLWRSVGEESCREVLGEKLEKRVVGSVGGKSRREML